ncbi:MAG: hypothetical protein K0R57_4897 [Paenibacillaceae bacterium]|jgi:hypothetical protein|nr:hypothetical protein [Paenibacillaceae bacterium]
MMNFYIHNIKVNSIASIGSLNIGNTILTGNRSTQITTPDAGESPDVESEGQSVAEIPPVAGNLAQ